MPVDHELLDKVDVLLVVEHSIHGRDVRMTEGHLYGCLPQDPFLHLGFHYLSLGNNFEGEQESCLLVFGHVHLSKVPFSQFFPDNKIRQ